MLPADSVGWGSLCIGKDSTSGATKCWLTSTDIAGASAYYLADTSITADRAARQTETQRRKAILALAEAEYRQNTPAASNHTPQGNLQHLKQPMSKGLNEHEDQEG